MFGSQALETAIGLALLFFIVASAASAILEVISRLFKKRSKDLWKGIHDLLDGTDPPNQSGPGHEAGEKDEGKDLPKPPAPHTAVDVFKESSIWMSAKLAAGQTLFRDKPNGPSYLSAKAFADVITEYLGRNPKLDPASGNPIHDVKWPVNLERRLAALANEGQVSILSLKSGLERWYDEAMARAEGSYKRWATMILFLIGLLTAVAGNVSAISTAQELWTNPKARAAIVAAAAEIDQEQDSTETGTTGEQAPASSKAMDSFTDAVDRLDELGFPVGWDDESRQVWTDAVAPTEGTNRNIGGAGAMVAGWFITAALVMLGAPFWFDVLTKLVALRGAGKKPPQAADDGASATGLLQAAARTDAPAPHDDHGAFATRVGVTTLIQAGAAPQPRAEAAKDVATPISSAGQPHQSDEE